MHRIADFCFLNLRYAYIMFQAWCGIVAAGFFYRSHSTGQRAGCHATDIYPGSNVSPSPNHYPKCALKPGGGGGTPCNGLYGEAPPERGTFFRLEVCERVRISRVQVWERVGKTAI